MRKSGTPPAYGGASTLFNYYSGFGAQDPNSYFDGAGKEKENNTEQQQVSFLGERWNKSVRWLGSVALLALLALATSSAHLRRQAAPAEPPQTVKGLLKYLSVEEPSHVRWCHGVNTRVALERALGNQNVHAIEADIQHVHGMPVVTDMSTGDSDSSSSSAIGIPSMFGDLSFAAYLERVMAARVAVKLDFKDPRAVIPVLKLLQYHNEFGNIQQPFILHADILPGAGGVPMVFQPTEFLRACSHWYPRGILSIGWSSTSCPRPSDGKQQNKKSMAVASAYSTRILEQMGQLLDEIGWKGDVVWPVRLCQLEQTYPALQPLLKAHPSWTLLLWNSEEGVTEGQLRLVSQQLRGSQTFLDLRESASSEKPVIVTFNLSASSTISSSSSSSSSSSARHSSSSSRPKKSMKPKRLESTSSSSSSSAPSLSSSSRTTGEAGSSSDSSSQNLQKNMTVEKKAAKG
eukprot:TRINITY_DN5136_c1_g1_i4.p1 TRINITY_DN5136_c1_g1~~TRINITY_DN5136_c1_g1_i4.p1  ORF type:complete len:460 (+),score=131.71 TRINITY_DN5136_c1_g1_i4:121-1500(+)